MLTIAVCGNHQVQYCTEADIAWTLEQMGHKVIRFQENQTRAEDMFQQCQVQRAQLFTFTHTHGWHTPGNMSLDDLWYAFRQIGIPTVTFHLDRFWGLQAADRRESQIGEHPMWHTDMVFTADGGNQQRFRERGVNHQWLPPGVAARHCYRGQYQAELACEIAFVGSKHYHPEYSFRTELINWLERTYHQRFRRFGHDCAEGVIRENRLNDLYASAQVVVGDSCFSGAAFYWSDRVPETMGRGGFLIHPETLGLQIHGLVTFEPGDVAELKDKIDYYLEHDVQRAAMALTGFEEVKKLHTYTNRMTTMLEMIGLS